MMSFTFHVASLAFAIADTMSFTNAVKTKLFKGGDLSSFVNILNSGAGYWFVIFASEIDAFSCFRVLTCLHDMLSSMLFLEWSVRLFKSLNRVSFSPFKYCFNRLIKFPVLPVTICAH